MKHLFFRLTYIIKPIDLGEENNFIFKIKGKEEIISIDLQKILEGSSRTGAKIGDINCTAITKRKNSEILTTRFESMTSEVHQSIKSFVHEIRTELSSSIFQTISIIRWKWGLSGLHNYVRHGGALNWSFDGNIWKAIPNEIRFGIKADFPVKKLIRHEDLTTIQNEITSNINEPLGHELFSEAWAQRKDNPRSSLVIGIAAAETGFKECVSKLIPRASWIMQNIPSPPLIKMLEEFLPELPVKLQIKGKTLSPPKIILDALKKGVTIRNKIIHGNDHPLKEDTLEEVLKAVRDLLYLLDYYCGVNWAEKNISIETKLFLNEDAIKNNAK